MRREWLERDYYADLGVSKDASDKDIRKAYRKLAQQYHPDNNPGDKAAEDRFKVINEAHSVIGDPETRRQYDETREMGPFVGGPGGTTHIRIEDLSDLFGEGSGEGFFGGLSDLIGGRTRRGPRRGTDVEADINLTFHEALNGVTKSVNVGGRTSKVKIPAGVADMARIRVRGKGSPGANGGPSGDLYVRVHVADHPLFKRAGTDLRITAPITYTEAALGAEVEVPTLDGTVTLRIPSGTSSGKTFRVRGKGFPKPGSDQRGDLLVTVEVDVPGDLTDEEQALLEKLREQEQTRPSPRSHLGV